MQADAGPHGHVNTSAQQRLAHYVQQLGAILQPGEDSSTPSQHTGLRNKLRNVILKLLELAIPPPTAPPTAIPPKALRDLSAVLRLLKLALESLHRWMASETSSLLLEILEKLFPLLARPFASPPTLRDDLLSIVGSIVLRLSETDPDIYVNLNAILCSTALDAYAAAIVLHTDSSNSAMLLVPLSSAHTPDSGAHAHALSLPLPTPEAADLLLQSLLKSIASAIAPHPETYASQVPPALLYGCCCLLTSFSVPLQSAAMQLIAVVGRSLPAVKKTKSHLGGGGGAGALPLAMRGLVDRMRRMIVAAPLLFAKLSISSSSLMTTGARVATATMTTSKTEDEGHSLQKEWGWRLTALLQSGIIDDHNVAHLATSAVPIVDLECRQRLCFIIAEKATVDIICRQHRHTRTTNVSSILEANANVFYLLPSLASSPSSSSALSALLETLRVYFASYYGVMDVVYDSFESADNSGCTSGGDKDGDGGGSHGSAHDEVAVHHQAKKQRKAHEDNDNVDSMDVDVDVDGSNEHTRNEPSPGLVAVTAVLTSVITSLRLTATRPGAVASDPAVVAALDSLADILHVIAPADPLHVARWSIETVTRWPGWGLLHFGGRGSSTPQEAPPGLKLLCTGLQAGLYCKMALLKDEQQQQQHQKLRNAVDSAVSSADGLANALLSCARSEGPSASAAMCTALVAFQLGVQDMTSPTALIDVFEAARGKTYTTTQVTRATLLPIAVTLSILSSPAVAKTSTPKSTHHQYLKKVQQQKQQEDESMKQCVASFMPLLLRMATSDDVGVLRGLIRGLYVVTTLCVDGMGGGRGDAVMSMATLQGVYAAQHGVVSSLFEDAMCSGTDTDVKNVGNNTAAAGSTTPPGKKTMPTSPSGSGSSSSSNSTKSMSSKSLATAMYGMALWMRPTLEALLLKSTTPSSASASAPTSLSSSGTALHRLLEPTHPPSSPIYILYLVDIVASFLSNAPIHEIEHCKALAEWWLALAVSPLPSVRAGIVRHASLLATPNFILALRPKQREKHDQQNQQTTHASAPSAPVPATHRSNADAALKIEHEIITAISKLKSKKQKQQQNESNETALSEELLALVGTVGWWMRSSYARMISLTILIMSLEQKDVQVSATAAECLRAIGAANQRSVKDLIFSTPLLVERIGRHLPHKPDLLHELADLVGMTTRSLSLAVIPRAVPQLAAMEDKKALEALAEHAAISPQKMILDHGHHLLASSLLYGRPSMDVLIPLAEEMTGQDFLVLAQVILPRTVVEMVSKVGASSDWGSSSSAEELPTETLARCAKMLELLWSVTHSTGSDPGNGTGTSVGTGNGEKNVSEFLAEEDHVTRMLKEFGDELEKQLQSVQISNRGRKSGGSGGGGGGGKDENVSSGGGGTATSSAQVVNTLIVVRRIIALIFLTGKFVGRFLPQFMVLFGACVRPGNHQAVKLQGLVGWRLLVNSLSSHAALQLGGIVNQVVVTLLDCLQEDKPVGSEAANVVENLINACKLHFPQKMRSMPPLPRHARGVRHVMKLIDQARGVLDTDTQVGLLLQSLGDEALSVKSTALQELRDVLVLRKEWVTKLKDRPGLQMRLLSALLKVAEPGTNSSASVAVQQTCAECLGVLGAIDPSVVKLDAHPLVKKCSSDAQLAIDVLTQHLVRLLKTAPNLQTLDSTTLAIQEVLRSHAKNTELLTRLSAEAALGGGRGPTAQGGGGDGGGSGKSKGKGNNGGGMTSARRETTPQPDQNALFSVLPEEIQAIVRPYLDSKFSYRTSGKKMQGTIFRPGSSLPFRRWLALWLTQLIDNHVSGDLLPLLQAIKPVLRHDITINLFIAPYVVHNAVCKGGGEALTAVTEELKIVLTAKDTSRDAVLCAQAVFSLLDTLQRWYEDAKVQAVGSFSATAATSTATTANGDSNGSGSGAAAAFASSEWSKINLLLSEIPRNTVARSAAACGAHARALLYYETFLRASHGRGANPASFQPPPAYADKEVTFLLEVYSKLEEPDGLDGLMKLRQGEPRPEDQRVVAEKAGSWGEALTLYERELARHERPEPPYGGNSSSSLGGVDVRTGNGEGGDKQDENVYIKVKKEEKLRSAAQRGYLNCLLQMGHWQGLLAQVEGMGALLGQRGGGGTSEEASRLAAVGAAAAWRLGKWSQLERYLNIAQDGLASLNSEERWEARIGLLLRTVATSKPSALVSSASPLHSELEAARAEIMGLFSAAAMDSYTRAYPYLVKLHMLQEISDAVAAAATATGPKDRRRMLRWDERLNITQGTLATQAPILALRRQLASITGSTMDSGKCWLQYAQLCRGTGHLDAAGPAVLEAAAVGIPGASFERVQLLYARGEHHRAISELQTLETQLAGGAGDAGGLSSETERAQYRARVLLKLAEWSAETAQGTREEVSSLFENALALRDHWDTGLFRYAVYLDELMKDARTRQENNAALQSSSAIDRLGGKSRIKLGEDRPHLSFLPEVLRNYGKSVQAGSRHIYRSLPRLLTLWFDFGSSMSQSPADSDERSIAPTIHALMQGLAKSIPAHCWLNALPQLISRICHRNEQVYVTTRHLVTQTTLAFPQQALWQLAAVSKSTVQDRRSAATAILSSAKRAIRTDDERAVFSANSGLCEQLIRLCHYAPPVHKRSVSLKKDLQLNALIRTLPLCVIVPTMKALTPSLPPLGVSHEAAITKYGWRPFDEIVTIADIQDEVCVMASLQKPKRIVLIGSDGLEYGFLAKPKDDLRKDCRMMEAAGVVNKVFEEEATARRRDLRLRRFAVVPITEDCGLVEWVEHTRPMRSCINDMANSQNEIKMENAAVKSSYDKYAKGTLRGGLPTWLETTVQLYPPRFHRWFLSTWAEPASWLSARLNYTRSYAAWCIVGHIAGLGDRHGENVLIDMLNGDALQIDFGCLFDKGLTLQVPEVVPFRLTQNVIDGFGVAGVEGVYRRSCEATLSVLRKHRETILSVMDTFVHDPLVEWSRKVNKEGGGGGGGAGTKQRGQGHGGPENASKAEVDNPQAKDAMATIEGRLKGTLLGVSSRPSMPLSVEGHVHRLMQEAMAKDKLCRMYIWWQAWY